MTRLPALALASLALTATSARGASPADAEFFEKRVRPVLVTHCLECHGAPGKKVKGGLELTSRSALLKGGDSGPALTPGEPNKSLLVEVVRYDGESRMPPKGRLADREIADIEEWVRRGAAWPESPAPPPDRPAAKAADDASAMWAFRPLADPAPPGPGHPIDAFLRQSRAAAKLTEAPPADKLMLLRRVTFDLTGLPPTPAEADAFLTDRRPDAYERVVDRLLAAPAHGQRWARHWLDVARYADSNGLDENTAFEYAYRYRDYVVDSLNADTPYDTFIREQIAGDLIPTPDPALRARRLTATGFLVLGPKLLAEPDKGKMVMDIVDEQMDTLGKVVLGLTVGCARCHDHKFDPLPTKEYYGLAGVFTATKTMQTLSTVAKANEREAPVPGKAALRMLAVDEGPPGERKPVQVHVRGNTQTLGEVAPRVSFRAVSGEPMAPLPDGVTGRLELATWVTRPDHPLTTRVIVNRLWQHHFGEGIVRTPDNFGKLGDRPTHPELLDWLARELVRRGWSLKAMHRLMVTSAAYRMGTGHRPDAALADPENRLLWRYPRRRLEAEAVRDAALAVAGTLDTSLGGSLFTGKNFDYVSDPPSHYTPTRRSLYLPVLRSHVWEFFQTFDFPDPGVSTGRRAATVVAPQALLLMNSPLVRDAASAFAERVLKAEATESGRLNQAYRLALTRSPTPAEAARASAFLAATRAQLGGEKDAERRAWALLCQALLASSEFVYLG